VAHEWIEQKAKQLFFSVFGKKRVGLMVRSISCQGRKYDGCSDIGERIY